MSPTESREARAFTVRADVRDGIDGETPAVRLDGYALTFDQPYDVGGGPERGGFTEIISPGAVTKTLQERADVRLLLEHDGLPLARTKSGTLSLVPDEVGLRVLSDLDPSDPDVQRIIPKARRGDLDEMSFAFRAIRQTWNDERTERRITELALYDVSIVTYPANGATSFSLRSALAAAGLADLPADIDADRLAVAVRDALARLAEIPAGDDDGSPDAAVTTPANPGRSIGSAKRQLALMRVRH